MDQYVELKTLYPSDEERTIDSLAKLYADKSELRSIVHGLMSTHVSDVDITHKSVLLKPNWVREELVESDYICLRTNDNLLLSILEEILGFSPSKVLIADAPIQGCVWDKMITKEFKSKVNDLSKKYGVPIVIKDFRRTISDDSKNTVSSDLHPLSDYVIFDLGQKSYLEPVSTEENKFRVTCYDPDRMAEVHHKGMHKYCIAKDVFDYDVIITIPKLKTHRMAGMTNALKLLVGINGDKDFLPHHRVGSLQEGGDNYKEKSWLRSLSNRFLDAGNRRRGSFWGRLFSIAGSELWKLSKPDKATMANAGWYGNDTIWRTVMDINTIALYGDAEGRVRDTQQRQLIIIMDGIIGGQGDGPLHPDPSPLGAVAISNNPYLMDVVAGELYHLNPARIPLLNAARNHIQNLKYAIKVDSKEIDLDEVKNYGIDIRMSPGWMDYNN
ncbi:MAG: DUF362 domain-containing protein [Bacteroidales bacterium]|nr:DUF362 domain-containing protein [Bacteroidales bacterium]